MTSLSTKAIIYREGLISVIENRGNHLLHFAKDREIKRIKGIILSSEQTAGITSIFVRKDNIVCLPTEGMANLSKYIVSIRNHIS